MSTSGLKPTSTSSALAQRQLRLGLSGKSILAEVEADFHLLLSQNVPRRAAARLMPEFRLAMQRSLIATARALIQGDMQAVRTLVQLSEGRIAHRYAGLCPDVTNGHASHDPQCQACQALMLASGHEGVDTGSSAGDFVVVPRKLTEEMELAFLETWFARSRPIDDPGMQDAWEAALDARPREPIDPDSANFKEGFATGHGEAEFLAEMIRKPVCSRCGATSDLDAETKCRPGGWGGDGCPGSEWPLAELWGMQKSGESAGDASDATQTAGKEE